MEGVGRNQSSGTIEPEKDSFGKTVGRFRPLFKGKISDKEKKEDKLAPIVKLAEQTLTHPPLKASRDLRTS